MDREGGKTQHISVILKKDRKRINIRSLMVDNIEITDEKIFSEMFKFYSQLYSTEFSKGDRHAFLRDIAEYIL